MVNVGLFFLAVFAKNYLGWISVSASSNHSIFELKFKMKILNQDKCYPIDQTLTDVGLTNPPTNEPSKTGEKRCFYDDALATQASIYTP